MLRYGADPNILHKDRTESISALMVSITQKGSLETVKLLVEAGADVNYTPQTFSTTVGKKPAKYFRTVLGNPVNFVPSRNLSAQIFYGTNFPPLYYVGGLLGPNG